jgi:8-oxo-dGTP pyrophosphatase MutT (NUDIX family)
MNARTIRLRRPATLSVQEGVFVPDVPSQTLQEIERRWSNLCSSNPAYFDGRLYHVLGVHRNGHGGCVLHVIDCAYRYFAVQENGLELGIRALGLKGVVMRDDRYLMGLRSKGVAAYKNMWEFAPAGSMEPGKNPADLIQRELEEETGLRSLAEPTSLAVIFDPVLQCWELVFALGDHAGEAAPRPDEYQKLDWRRANDLPANLSPIARQIAQMLSLV